MWRQPGRVGVFVLVAQSCLTVCDPTDCGPPDSSVLGDSPGTNPGVGGHTLLQGVFLTQGLGLGLKIAEKGRQYGESGGRGLCRHVQGREGHPSCLPMHVWLAGTCSPHPPRFLPGACDPTETGSQSGSSVSLASVCCFCF